MVSRPAHMLVIGFGPPPLNGISHNGAGDFAAGIIIASADLVALLDDFESFEIGIPFTFESIISINDSRTAQVKRKNTDHFLIQSHFMSPRFVHLEKQIHVSVHP